MEIELQEEDTEEHEGQEEAKGATNQVAGEKSTETKCRASQEVPRALDLET